MAEVVGPGGFAHGIDATARMLEKARRTAEKLGVTNVAFHDATFDATGLPEQSVDLVISNCSINHAADKPAVWREVYRILKPGGRFVISDIYSTQTVPEIYRNDPAAVAECWAGAVTRPEYLNTLHSTGFSDVRVLEESDPYEKGAIEVVSITLAGTRPANTCCCGS